METKHVLATSFPGWHIAETSVTSQHLTLFKVNVNGVIPTTATIDQRPNFASTALRSRRNLVVVGGQTLSTICFDGPGRVIGAVGPPKLEGTLPSYRNRG